MGTRTRRRSTTYVNVVDEDRVVALRARLGGRVHAVPSRDLIHVLYFVYEVEDYVWHCAPAWFGDTPDARRVLLNHYFEHAEESKLLMISAFLDRLSGEVPRSPWGVRVFSRR